MQNTENLAIPFPEPGDSQADYPAVAQRAAEILDAAIPNIQHGTFTNDAAIAAGKSLTITVNFPTQFSAPPTVVVTPGNGRVNASSRAVAVGSVQIALDNLSSGECGAGYYHHWVAIGQW